MNGVCVEEIPLSERTSCAAVAADSYLQYNKKHCTHPYLATCFNEYSDVMYGTLSHSHLLLVLLSFANKGNWKLADKRKWKNALHSDGSFDAAAVAALDSELGKLMKDGLRMEVLSCKI